MKLIDTGKLVSLPIPFSYEYLFGGACRNTLLGVPVRDYDFCFINQGAFDAAIAELKMLGFSCGRVRTVDNRVYPRIAVWFRLKRRYWLKKTVVYELFLCPGSDRRALLRSTDFRIHACFQRPGENIQITAKGLADLNSMVLEVNDEFRPAKDLRRRARKLRRKHGFTFGASLLEARR